MTGGWAAFAAGMALGGLVGALSMAFCRASGDASRAEDGWVWPVRCRDCRHYETEDCTCRLRAYAWERRVPGFYCASGEKREDDR